MSSQQAPAPMRALLGLKEPDKPGRIIVWDTAEITVGRAAENDIVLDDSDASRQHALFLRTAQGHQVQDLGASNGTLLGGEPLRETHLLQNKDVIKVGEVQITFIQTRKDPSALGLEVSYASALKGFMNPGADVDPGATTLGLAMPVEGSFDVDAVGSYGLAPDAEVQPPKTRDLDLEFNDFVPGEALPSLNGEVSGDEVSGSDCLSLHLELEGLSPDLARVLQGLLGKVIELPALRIRVKGE